MVPSTRTVLLLVLIQQAFIIFAIVLRTILLLGMGAEHFRSQQKYVHAKLLDKDSPMKCALLARLANQRQLLEARVLRALPASIKTKMVLLVGVVKPGMFCLFFKFSYFLNNDNN
jgi:hypothetical protein